MKGSECLVDGKGGDGIFTVTPPVRIKCAVLMLGYVYVLVYFEWLL